MDLSEKNWSGFAAWPPSRMSSRNVASLTSDLIPLFDLACLFLAASLSTLLYTHWLGLAPHFGAGFERAALVAAVLASFILYDKDFGSVASRGHMPLLVRSHALRFTLFAGAALALGTLSQALDNFPRGWLALWFASSLLLSSLTRVLAARYLRRLQRQGVLTEVIAVVGAGPVADRLVQALRQTRPETIELLGVFDDKIIGAVPSLIPSDGTLAQLLELGKTRKIDWILLTLPPTAEQRLLSIVGRLKALSVPIGLCPQHVGLTVPYRTIDYVGDSLPVSLLADRPIRRWNAVNRGVESFLPRWIVTVAALSLAAIEALADGILKFVLAFLQQRAAKFTFYFDNYNVAGFTDTAAGFGQDRFGYAVTPNADHMIRLHEDASFRASYAAASYVLLDSRFLSNVLRVTKGIRLPVCPGSDLTAKLFSDVIAPDDPLVLIGGSDEQARQLGERYHLRRLAHFNPPMGFIRDPQAVEACLSFIEAHSPFRFCLLAVGAPQQEAIAQLLKGRGIARGLALCVGASINFLTGGERRAPLWLQHCGMEWSFRLMQAPGHMAKRYLVRGPRVFGLLNGAQIVLRAASAPKLRLVSLPVQETLPAAYSYEPARLTLAERLVLVPDQPALPASPPSGPARLALAERENRAVSASI
jgi:exopolysaccharide biosynthesis WecB/TagA/CpsF family protein